MVRAATMRTLLLGSAAAVFLPAAALAQDAAQPAEDATATATPVAPADAGDEVIVVTARRTEESLQDVPASISAFNEKALDRIQASDPTGLQGAVPNLNIVQGRGSSNATNIFIRGVGQPDALQTFDPAVGVYVDDVYYSRIRGTQLDLLDIERIEVLRGPQGTLYGKNTIGGALKVVTRKPGQQLRANASVALGSYGQVEAKASVSGPLSDTAAAGVAVMRVKRDGYVEDELDNRDYNDRDSWSARAALAFTPYETIHFDVTADYTHDDASLNVGDPLNDLVTFSGTILPVSGLGDKYDWTGRTTPGLPNSTKLTHYGFAGTATADLTDQLTFKSITAYRRLKTKDYIDIDATQYEVGDVLVDVSQHQFSQEFQLTYEGDRFNAVGGLYYLREKVGSHQEAYADDILGPLFLNSPFLRTIDDKLKTTSYAAYLNGSYDLTDALRLSAGLRYTSESKDYWRTTSTFFGLLPAFNGTYEFAPPKARWKDWSPMVSLDWQATDDIMFYVRAAKGFKSGGFNGRANTVAESTEYDPEKVWSYEAGFKSRIANQLTLNGAVFTSSYKDFQARVSGLDTDPVTGLPSPKLSVLNAGKLRISGAELEASWTPVHGLLLDSQIGYLDADYKTFEDARFPNGSRAFQTPAFSPKWTMRFGAQYAFELGSAGSITIGGQTRYKSRTALAVDNTLLTGVEIDGLFQKGYWVHDARIVWDDASKKYSVGVYGNNLSDKAYKTDGQEFSSVGNIRTVYYGAPRTVTVRFTARY